MTILRGVWTVDIESELARGRGGKVSYEALDEGIQYLLNLITRFQARLGHIDYAAPWRTTMFVTFNGNPNFIESSRAQHPL